MLKRIIWTYLQHLNNLRIFHIITISVYFHF